MFAKDFANFDALLLYCHGTFSVNRVGQWEGIFFMIMLPSKGGEEHVVSNIAWLREKWCAKHDMSKANSRSHTKLRKLHVCRIRSFLLIGSWKLAENTKVTNGMQNVDGRLKHIKCESSTSKGAVRSSPGTGDMGQMPMKGSNAPWPQRILYGFAARCRNGRDRSVATAEIVQRTIRSTFPNCEAQTWHLSSKFSASHCIRVSCAVCLEVKMDDDWYQETCKVWSDAFIWSSGCSSPPGGPPQLHR